MGVTQRWPLPANLTPTGTRCLQVIIPDDDDYQTLLLAAVNALSYWMAWQRDDLNSGAVVADQFKKVMASWTDCAGQPIINNNIVTEDDLMALQIEPYCDDNGLCRLHFRCDVCDPWIDVALLSDLQNGPGAGTPQPSPGGGSINNCVNLDANGSVLLDAPVSTGDVITILDATGSANDGVETPLRCPDGSVYNAGNCLPGDHLDAGDPVITAPHMSVIVNIAGVDYGLYPGASLTVPGGVTNANARFHVNQHTPSTTTGQYRICYKQTNNQAKTGCHHLDFRVSSYAFQNNGSTGGTPNWVAGQGWSMAAGAGHAMNLKFVAAAAFTCTRLQYQVNDGVAGSDPSSAAEWAMPPGTFQATTRIAPLLVGTNTADGTFTATSTELDFVMEDAGTGTMTLIEVNIYWSGVDPMPTFPTC